MQRVAGGAAFPPKGYDAAAEALSGVQEHCEYDVRFVYGEEEMPGRKGDGGALQQEKGRVSVKENS